MKALTVWQPWASLISTGEKKFETRSWSTKYRGPIAIHAASKDPCKILITPELEKYALQNKKLGGWCCLPLGAVIATAELVNVWYICCHPGPNVSRHVEIGAKSLTADKHAPDFVPSKKEMALGDWTPGRFAWELANVKQLEPIPAKGRQGLWNWNPENNNGVRIKGGKKNEAIQI